MKKSQLRKIIRESVKEILTEQAVSNNSHQTFDMEVCGCQDISGAPCPNIPMYQIGYIGPYATNTGFTCDGVMCDPDPNGLDIGSVFELGGPPVSSITLTFKLLSVYNPVNSQTLYDLTSSSCPNAAVTYNCDTINGCFDPGTGNGQYVTLSGCQQQCNTPAPSYNCINGVCNDPGNGLGQYITLSACQQNCGIVTPSWDCNNGVCSDPGNGNGQYFSLSSCQSSCVAVSYDCVNGVCSDPGTGNGTYTSLATCQSNCSVSGCTDPQAINYDPNFTIDDGSCYGCMNTLAADYCPLCNADCQNTVGGTNTGCCTSISVPGCTDPLAQGTIITGCTGTCNEYDPLATIDDGSCCTVGCTDSLATNYDPNACIDDNSCIPISLPPDTYDCGVNYNCVINTTGTGTYSGGTTTQNLSACQNNCQAPTYNIGCADPTATPCSQFPPAMQNSIQCYESNHDGCGTPADPNDTSCCTYTIPVDSFSTSDTCLPPPSGCPPLTMWNGQPHCQCLSVSWTPGSPTITQGWRDDPILTPQTPTPTCSDTYLANYSGPSAQDVINAYQIGLQNNQAYGMLDGNSIFCTESCGFSNTHWACDCCGPLHCDDISSDNWVPYGCWKCDDDTSCSDNGNFISTGQNFYNTEPACVAQASTNCPPPPPTPRNLPGSKARLQELANIK